MQLDTILLKVASRCNINCSYCYVYNQGDTNWQRMPKHMSAATVEDEHGPSCARLRDCDLEVWAEGSTTRHFIHGNILSQYVYIRSFS